jgi:hypothetical protein
MVLELRQKKTVTTMDIVFVLNRLGTPIYVSANLEEISSCEETGLTIFRASGRQK